VVACAGDRGHITYKKSRRGDAEIDRAVTHVLRQNGREYGIEDFSPFGYDERQYCSPGINLPVGRLSRTPHGKFPEYHTSADNLEFVEPAALSDTVQRCLDVIEVIEENRSYRNLSPMGEPQLGNRGVLRSNGDPADKLRETAMFWVLNFSDGEHTLLDIAERSGLSFGMIAEAAEMLVDHELLATVQSGRRRASAGLAT
jgi:aminopeptidase-like protein